MNGMDDETDLLLDQFLAAASGERTDETRERYRRVLAPLRAPTDGETGVGPGVRLLLRIPPALQDIEAEELETGAKATAASLWTRLVTWLRRTSDAGDASAADALVEAQARLREVRERRRKERYASLHWIPEMPRPWQRPSSHLDGGYRYDPDRDDPYRDDPYRDDAYGDHWADGVPLAPEPEWLPEPY
jgi:hypothetical protein